MKNNTKSSLSLLISLMLLGCGGGNDTGVSDSNQQLKVGQFKDAAVSGISYKINKETLKTGEFGDFNYQDGDEVEFLIGTLSLGATEARSVLTPMDLTSIYDYDDDRNINVVRILMSLDEDRNPENGIQISDELITYLTNELDLSEFDFSDSALESLEELLSFEGADGSIRSISIPGKQKAIAHFEETLRCQYGGIYLGLPNVDGQADAEPEGAFALVIDPATVRPQGFAAFIDEFGYIDSEVAYLSGEVLDLNGKKKNFAISNSEYGVMMNVTMDGDLINGRWSYQPEGLEGTLDIEKELTWEIQGKRKYVGVYTRNPEINTSPTGVIEIIQYEDGRLRTNTYDFVEPGEDFLTSGASPNEDGSYDILMEIGSGYSDTINVSLPSDSQVVDIQGESYQTGANYQLQLSSCRL